ncbi:hypothetical protein EG329_002307 [Mollisiaceae sp. DMI_Dod_QoI]|nr:hypothetical protein EG329_002307 [Helotiales sp. DMI_Dod_QoI]
MQFSVLSVAAIAVSLSSTLVSGTVYQGLRTGVDGSQQQVAWTNGTPDICSGFSTIRNDNGNPCGIQFFVDGNNGPFVMNNCGVGNPALERNGQFNSVCTFQPLNIGCAGGVTIKQTWQC